MKWAKGFLFLLILSGGLPQAVAVAETSEAGVLNITEALAAVLQQSATIEFTSCTYRPGGHRGERGGAVTFEGEVRNLTSTPVEVLIQVGFKESHNVSQGRDLWFVKNERRAMVKPGEKGEPFRITVVAPPEVNKSIRLGIIQPLGEIRGATGGMVLDATVASLSAKSRPIPEFDPMALAEEHRQKVGDYEIVWQAMLPQPDGTTPARFIGVIRNPKKRQETVLLQAGFVNRLNRMGEEKAWSWKREEEVPIRASDQEVPFELTVSCPAGIYVGIANEVYEGHAWLLTEAVREAMRKAEEEAKRSRAIPPEHILFDPQVKQVAVLEARFAYTKPQEPGNAGRFEFTVANRSQSTKQLLLRYGFLTIQPPAPWDRGSWHFIGEKPLELGPGADVDVVDEVRCHVAMADLVEAGMYGVYILVAPQESP